MNVKLSDIDEIWRILVAYLRDKGVDEVDIKADYYWNIPAKDRYNPYVEPEEFDLGQLSEDWGWLTAMLERENPPIAYALVWLSTIIRSIGEEIVG